MKKLNSYVDHNVSNNEKDKPTWYIPAIDYYIDLANTLSNHSDTTMNLNNANAIFDKKTFEVVLQTLNSTNFKDDFEQIGVFKDIDLITPIKERYLGEYIRQPDLYTVTVEDDIADIKHNTEAAVRIKNILVTKLVALINQKREQEQQSQIDGGDMTMADIDIAAESKRIKEEYFNERSEEAMNIIELIKTESRASELLIQNFFYLWATEHVYFKIIPTLNKVVIEVIPPYEYKRIPNSSTIFTEDDNGGVHSYKMSYEDILNTFKSKLKKEDIEYLKTLQSKNTNSGLNRNNLTQLLNSRYIDIDSDLIHKDGYITSNISNINDYSGNVFSSDRLSYNVEEVYFKTNIKIGILTYLDNVGQEQSMEVSSDYKLNKENGDISIDIIEKEVLRIAYRIGGKLTGIYIKPEGFAVQRNELENRYSSKLPIIGVSNLLVDYNKKPIPTRVMPYHIFYILLTIRINQEIARFNGYINLLPDSIFEDNDHFTKTERLNYMFQSRLLMFNDEEVDLNVLNAMKSIGNDSFNYLKTLYEVRDNFKKEAWDVANMNDARYGDIDTRGGKGNTQEAIIRMSTASLLLFSTYDYVKERLYQAIADYGRLVYVDGIKKSFKNKDGKIVNLNVTHEELLYKEIGINVTLSQQELEKINFLKQNIPQAAMQNNEYRLAIEASVSDNPGELRKLVTQLDEANKKRELYKEQLKAEVEKYKEESQNKRSEFEYNKAIDVETLKGEYGLLEKDKDILMKMVEFNSFNPDSNLYTADANQLEEEIKRKKSMLLDMEMKLKNKQINEKKGGS